MRAAASTSTPGRARAGGSGSSPSWSCPSVSAPMARGRLLSRQSSRTATTAERQRTHGSGALAVAPELADGDDGQPGEAAGVERYVGSPQQDRPGALAGVLERFGR